MDTLRIFLMIVFVSSIVSGVTIYIYHTAISERNRMDRRSMEERFALMTEGMLKTISDTLGPTQVRDTILHNLTHDARRIARKEILPTFVYFVADKLAGMVKIGYSNDPTRRLIALQTSHHTRLEILAMLPGDERLESRLHRQFKMYRTEGEWFRLEGELASYIAEVARSQQT